ncbi:MAG: ABC transporter ATP-binding protein [Clostridiales bacterium]|nr:ABC transporter ATP-binding protein [Clostridiales bacterium]
MIEVKGISFSYGKRTILSDINFTASPGDCVAILGNNGAGKSTLITCLNKIRRPDEGTIYIDGKNVFEMGRLEAAQNIAYVAQKNEFTQTTVYEAILLGRRPYMKWGITSRDYEICDAVLERMGMQDLKLRYVNELSGGEAQKVMLARAFVQQPKLLLLDEPTSNLDPRNQYEMMKLVRQVAEENGITVLVVIHDLNLALRYCNQFIMVKDGLVYDYGGISVITEQSLLDVYGIKTTLISHGDRVFAMIE